MKSGDQTLLLSSTREGGSFSADVAGYPPDISGQPQSYPCLPVLFSTRLRLELLLRETPVDLRAITDIVLADVGATLQILRIVGEEYVCLEDRPCRIEHCIVSLGVERCYELICSSNICYDGWYVDEWQFCRRIAENARELAKTLDVFSPEEAYLVGLLHRIGSFPHRLGWTMDGFTSRGDQSVGVTLANDWHLPHFLASALREQDNVACRPKWNAILMLANEIALLDAN